MDSFAPILLDDDWRYFFAESQRSDYSDPGVDDSTWIPLPSLADWSVASSKQAGADWFRRTLVLEPTETCVNYILHISKVPETVLVYINGKLAGEAQGNKAFKNDVTPCVALGENTIAMKLISESNTSGGGFGEIRLQPVACEDE